MGKGDETRQRIIETSAALFNTRGYFGVSVADVAKEANLEKGSLYNHFGGKEAIALASLDYAVVLFQRRLQEKLEGQAEGRARLEAVIETFVSVVEDPFLPGGCAMMNTAVEADDAQPALREAAKEAYRELLRFMKWNLLAGMRKGEFRRDADADMIATSIVALMEGGIVLARLFDDPAQVHGTAVSASAQLDSISA